LQLATSGNDNFSQATFLGATFYKNSIFSRDNYVGRHFFPQKFCNMYENYHFSGDNFSGDTFSRDKLPWYQP
jgi:uncharacterized protein YjbI with pentapeptide repeats